MAVQPLDTGLMPHSFSRSACLALSLISGVAAASDIEFPAVTSGSQADFEAAMQDLTAAFSFKPLAPAEPLGLIGFHAGVMASYTGVENEDSWRSLTGSGFDDLGVIAIAAAKGLPFGIDVGAFVADVPDSNVSLYGAELRYALAEGGVATPAIGIRLSYTKLEGVDELDFDTKAVDLSISKGLTFITPYVGVGRVFSTATPNGIFSTAEARDLKEADINENKFYGGVRFALLLLNVTAEIDQTGDNSSYNLRLSFAF